MQESLCKLLTGTPRKNYEHGEVTFTKIDDCETRFNGTIHGVIVRENKHFFFEELQELLDRYCI